MHEEGFEPPTSRFVAECSIQLSYWCKYSIYYTLYLIFFQENLAKLYLFKENSLKYFIKCVIIYKCLSKIKYRGVAQLVARVVWDHEVAGSIPVTSTIFRVYKKILIYSFLFIFAICSKMCYNKMYGISHIKNLVFSM